MLADWHKGQSIHQWSGKPAFNPRSSHTKDSKMVLDASLLITLHHKIHIKGKVEHHKIHIKGKVEQSKERRSTLLNDLV